MNNEITTGNMLAGELSAVSALWAEAFGDAPEFIERFLAVLDPSRDVFVARLGGTVAAMHCAVPAELCDGDMRLPGVYFYSCCTRRDLRGQGIFRRLVADSHAALAARGDRFAVVTPAREGLFPMYRSLSFDRAAYGVPNITGAPDAPLRAAERAAFLSLERLPFDGDYDRLWRLRRATVGRCAPEFCLCRPVFELCFDGYRTEYLLSGGEVCGYTVFSEDVYKNEIIVYAFHTEKPLLSCIMEDSIRGTALRPHLDARAPKALWCCFGGDIPAADPRIDLFAER